MRFLVLQILFVNLGELWGLDKLCMRLPHMRRWLLAMRGRDSNPFKHVHEDELYYRAHREWWTKKMPQRLFPSVEEEVARLRMKSVGSSDLSPLQLRWSMRLRSTTRSILSVWCCASLAGRRLMGLRVCNRRALCTWWA